MRVLESAVLSRCWREVGHWICRLGGSGVGAAERDDDSNLGSDDDDEELEDDGNEAESTNADIVLAQYDKAFKLAVSFLHGKHVSSDWDFRAAEFCRRLPVQVTRVRNKWKVMLKDGVMSINGRDYIFKKAACEFEW